MVPAAEFLHVAAAVVRDRAGRVLLARRPERLHQGGKWEFPGGKVEPGERVEAALARELEEELAITPLRARPLIRVRHRYPDRAVLLDVWQVEDWSGTPHGAEGQATAWTDPDRLSDFTFPAANRPIVAAARLPDRYLITPEPGEEEARDGFIERLRQVLSQSPIRLVQFRAPRLSDRQYRALARKVIAAGRAQGARVLLNASPTLAAELGADGVHLNGRRLAACRRRPLPGQYWVAASCHSDAELRQAEAVGVDFAVLSPVQATASHPLAEPIGWSGFEALTETAAIPVYALGGVGEDDRGRAWMAGGQGIAAIRDLWGES